MSASGATYSGHTLVAGAGRGEALRLDEPLSLWGGMDPQTGTIIDPHHPQAGRSLAGYVVLMPAGRGSSSSSSILAESIRAGTAPAAILLLEADSILALGSIVAAELYGRAIPVLLLDQDAYRSIPSGARVDIDAGPDGAVIRVER